tara:strand:+ start:1848 stop:2003 length:156 start_codon:yes stop_codon:yes gene_type:complete
MKILMPAINIKSIIIAKHFCLSAIKEIIMWTTPAATEMRFGFEVTMYVMNK